MDTISHQLLRRITLWIRLRAIFSALPGTGSHTSAELGSSNAHTPQSDWAQRTPGTLRRKWTLSDKALLLLTSEGRAPQTPVLHGNKESLFSGPTPTPWSHSGPIDRWKAMYKSVTQMWEEENKKEGTQIRLHVQFLQWGILALLPQSYWEIHTPKIFNALSPPETGAIKRLDYLLLLITYSN